MQQITAPVLCIGAGGLGCEILKNLYLSGCTNIHVIDMDTIDLSNLNRQFLFRTKDIGQSKAHTAAAFINSRAGSPIVTAYHCAIQDMDDAFYRQFAIVISGLDSITARRWINGKLVGLVELDMGGDPIVETVIPLIDGGTEGFLGHCKVIVPRFNSCFECMMPLFPPQTSFPLCTLQATPRTPEHCIIWAKIIAWPEQSPFGKDVSIDFDNPDHTQWLYECSAARAAAFNIQGVDPKLVKGVAKGIIPAIASTNAMIAAQCVNEAVKYLTEYAANLEDYALNYGNEGCILNTQTLDRDPHCIVCGDCTIVYRAEIANTLSDLVAWLGETMQMQQPSIMYDYPLLMFGALYHKYASNLDILLLQLVPANAKLTVMDPSRKTPVYVIVQEN